LTRGTRQHVCRLVKYIEIQCSYQRSIATAQAPITVPTIRITLLIALCHDQCLTSWTVDQDFSRSTAGLYSRAYVSDTSCTSFGGGPMIFCPVVVSPSSNTNPIIHVHIPYLQPPPPPLVPPRQTINKEMKHSIKLTRHLFPNAPLVGFNTLSAYATPLPVISAARTYSQRRPPLLPNASATKLSRGTALLGRLVRAPCT